MTDQKPKYLNTSDTLAFKKSYGLFAMNFAKNSSKEQLILAEGYMDVIALHQAGFDNAIAGLGTALTTEQAHLIARNTTPVGTFSIVQLTLVVPSANFSIDAVIG